MNEMTPTAQCEQRPNPDIRKSDFSKFQAKVKSNRPPGGRNRQMILDEIAERWVGRGYYPTLSRAMIALLEGVE